MPLVTDHNRVLEIFDEARERKWVLPSFNAENLTTIEAILEAVSDYGKVIGINNLPIIIGITNNYSHRPQSVYYTQTRRWQIGLRLFLSDLQILASSNSPYSNLRIMIHLDHIQWDEDKELLKWDMNQFSSIMYDASTLPLKENIQKTSAFVKKYGDKIIIEGACGEIVKVSSEEKSDRLTTHEIAEKYYRETGVDIIVANLGTEHRATASNLQYQSKLACEIKKRVGPHLCLHGATSLSPRKIKNLFDDGICKVNVWTILERDSSPALFHNMLQNAAKIVGSEKAKELLYVELLGRQADYDSAPFLDYFTTTYRQGIIFNRMKKIITKYLASWYV